MGISALPVNELPRDASVRPIDKGRYEMEVGGIRFTISGHNELVSIFNKYKELLGSQGGRFLSGTFRLLGKGGLMKEARANENFKTGCLLYAIGKLKGESVASRLLIEPVRTAFRDEQARLERKS